MKVKLLIIVLLLSGMVYGQNKYTEMFNEANASLYERQDSIITPKDTFINDFNNWGETNKNPYLWWNAATWTMIDSADWYYQALERLKSYQTYIDHCHADTLKAEMFQEEYLIDMGNYREMISYEKLLERGYRYFGRIVKDSTFTNIEYWFVGKGTFEGYVEWFDSLLNQKTY